MAKTNHSGFSPTSVTRWLRSMAAQPRRRQLPGEPAISATCSKAQEFCKPSTIPIPRNITALPGPAKLSLRSTSKMGKREQEKERSFYQIPSGAHRANTPRNTWRNLDVQLSPASNHFKVGFTTMRSIGSSEDSVTTSAISPKRSTRTRPSGEGSPEWESLLHDLA
jgi:hypothetical protein